MLKYFAVCGHKGLGLYCHRCAQSKDLEEKAAKLAESKTKEDREKSGLLKTEAARLKAASK